MFKQFRKHTRQESASGRNSDHIILPVRPGLATSLQSAPMLFSSATPAGQVLSLTKRHAKSVHSPSVTSSQLPKIPNCTPASQWFLLHTFRKGLAASHSESSTCPRGAARAVRHPWDDQTSAILFSNSTASPDARQKSCVLPKHSGSSSRQNNRDLLLASRPNCRTSSKSCVI